jgi:hypothetical protein
MGREGRRTQRTGGALAGVAGLAVALLVAGCSGVNHLREAQLAFNEASTLDNQHRLGLGADARAIEVGDRPDTPVPASAALTATTAIQGGYAATLLSLEKIPKEDTKRLRADRLWGVKLTLEALAQWRLGRYDDALRTAAQALGNEGAQLFPRDAAVLTALPGLINTDIAYQKIRTWKRDPKTPCRTSDGAEIADLVACVEGRLVGPRGAVSDLGAARRKVDPGHPVNVYLIQSQLGAYRNYQVAFQEVNRRSPAADDPARGAAQCSLRDLRILLESLDEDTRVVRDWKDKFGLDPSKCQD